MLVSAHKKSAGFTLVELLVVITIIAILAAVGTVIYQGITKSARDTAKKADVEAIAKAYEASYGGQYSALTSTNFASGTIPKTPTDEDYYNVVADDGSGFKVCAALEGYPGDYCNSSSSTCYCKTSTQGTINPSAGLSGTGYNEIGYNSSCPVSLSQSLVGYWKMDEGNGSNVADSSGNNHTMNRGNLNWISGKIGPFALIGNGSTGGTLADSSLLEGMSSLTISAWVYPTQLDGTDRHIVHKGQWNSDPPMSYRFMYQTDWGSGTGYPRGSWRFHIKTSVGEFNVEPGYAYSDSRENQWYLLAGVYDGAVIRFYINGAEVKNANASGTININTYVTEIGRGFVGTIDDVRIYNRALSPTEISDLYSSGNGCTT